MSKFGNIRKKLLAGLCAFASGVGGAGAAPQDTVTSEGLHLLYRAYRGNNDWHLFCTSLSTEEQEMFNFLVGLEDSNDPSILQAVSTNDYVKDTARNSRFRVKSNKSAFDFTIETEMYKGGTENDMFPRDPILIFRVEIEYIAKRLVSKHHYKIEGGNLKIGNENKGAISGIKNMDAFLNVAKCALYDIAINDVMGFGIPVYNTASANAYAAISNDDPPAPTQASHPDFAGCWDYFLVKYFIPIVNTNSGGENAFWVAAPNSEGVNQFSANRKEIFEKFFGDGSKFKGDGGTAGQPGGSDYYRTMWKAPTTTTKNVMGAGGKAGVAFGAIGTLVALGAGGYTYLEHNKMQEMQDAYEERSKELRSKNKGLQSQLDKWNKVEKLAKLKNVKSFFSVMQMAEKGGSGVAGKKGNSAGNRRGNSASNNRKR